MVEVRRGRAGECGGPRASQPRQLVAPSQRVPRPALMCLALLFLTSSLLPWPPPLPLQPGVEDGQLQVFSSKHSKWHSFRFDKVGRWVGGCEEETCLGTSTVPVVKCRALEAVRKQRMLQLAVPPPQVFGEESTQDEVYAETQPLIRSVLDGGCCEGLRREDTRLYRAKFRWHCVTGEVLCCSRLNAAAAAVHCAVKLGSCPRALLLPSPPGYNVCIFAYGQTGSGEWRY